MRYSKRLIFTIALVAGLAFMTAGTATAATWYVPDNFTSIQEAIDNATVVDGDMIYVENDTYEENVDIYKELSVIGILNGTDMPVINGVCSGTVVNITADNVTLQNFGIINSGSNQNSPPAEPPDCGVGIFSDNNWLQDLYIHTNLHGIYANEASDNTLTELNISENSGNGIVFDTWCDGNTIEMIDLLSNDLHGIIFKDDCDGNTLQYLYINDSGQSGLKLKECCDFNNLSMIISGNNAEQGVMLVLDCDFNIFEEIGVFNNTNSGLHFKECCDDNSIVELYSFNNSKHGVNLADTNDGNSFEDLWLYRNGKQGLQLGAVDGDNNGGTDNCFENVYAWNNTGHGVSVSAVDSCFTNVESYNNDKHGLRVGHPGSTGNSFDSVQTYNNGWSGIHLGYGTHGNDFSTVSTWDNGWREATWGKPVGTAGISLANATLNSLTDVISHNNTHNGVAISTCLSGDPAEYNTFTNVASSYNSWDGFKSADAGNNTFIDCSAYGNTAQGFRFQNSLMNQLTDCNAWENGLDGFRLVEGSDSNTLTGCIATGNTEKGIWIKDSGSNRVVDAIVMGNPDYGIRMEKAPDTRVEGGWVTTTNQAGISIRASDRAVVSGCTVRDNTNLGFEVMGGTDNATVKGCSIINNTVAGMYIRDGPVDCLIYNNFFNNTANADFANPTAVMGNRWNLTEWATGPNIIGGPLLGGNCWVQPDGMGWSQITPDADHDGFCDEEYNVSDSDPSDNWDQYPLHIPYADFTTSGRSGVAPYTVTFTDASGLYDEPADYYNWTFGDGSGVIFQTATSIQHTYTVPGIYDVTLFVTNMYGNDTVVKTDWIYVYQEGYGTGGGGSGAGGQTDFSGSGPIRSDSEGSTLMETVVEASDGIAKLTIPAGTKALDKDGNPLGDISIVPLADIPKEPKGLFSFAGYAWQCTPAGATFDPPITMTLTFTDAEWAALDPASMTLEWYNPATGLWETIPVVIDPATHTITAQISHFSVFALFQAAEEVVTEEEGEIVIVEEVPTTAAPTTAPTTQSPLIFAPVLALGAIPFLLRRK